MELDNPVWHALVGRQSGLGVATELAARFDPSICPFAGFEGDLGPSHWADMASLLKPGEATVLVNLSITTVPSEWTVLRVIEAIQMLGDHLVPDRTETRPSEQLLQLGTADVADMLALVAEAQPGPFRTGTISFGGYLGIRRKGALIAMAGQRLGLTGYTEISAVATRSDHRRQGMGERLVRAVATGIVERGEIPFLHVSTESEKAIRLYEDMGFTRRRSVSFSFVQAPGVGASPD
jgi:ribosomal protein S18 acetylase RimI-like enzyme